MRRVSQAEIAEKLDISRTTVTKALNDDPNISDRTKEKVKGAAQELGYIVNNIGRSLVNNRTMTIGLIVPKIAHSFYSTLLEGIYNAANMRGYDIIPMVSFEDCEREEKMIRKMLAMHVDGIVMGISETTTSLDSFQIVEKNNIPLVFLDRALPYHHFSEITTNDFEITYNAIEFTIQKGYKNFGFLGGQPHLSSGVNREMGYRKALKDHNLSIDENQIITGGYSKQFGYENLIELHKLNSLPELLFCATDEVALGVYKAAKKLGIKIPDDVAVIGFGDLEIARYLNPPLTTISMPIDKLAEEAIATLVAEIENPNREKTVNKLEGSLIVRKSI